ncbi:transcriptional regulator MalT [Actinomadura rubteroloni]|uniref:Transcriptional regulator MalT n=1 Tax=Actinomadura rubteroloni TaxID=1926885 RepID=A0A2P4UIS0_9ACTN|nr:helix-turn-helix transcriptional regulator [Actinomadura rubteroloni]POM24965.1 transcriptional regulator MalT [Actinomadura rubteroloni]
MKLIERDDEFRLLDRLYTGCVGGRGAVVLTGGPAGSGKTALLHAFADRVARRGGRFFAVTASGSERMDPFGLIDHLLNTIGGRDGDARARADGSGDLGREILSGRQTPIDVLQGVHAAVAERWNDRPLVIGVDDVHFADEPSLQCLRYIARRIESSAIMIVFNECSSHERRLATLHAETLNLPYAHRIRLGLLADDGVAAHVEQRLGPDTARRVAAACAAAGGGNPLLTQALVDDHQAASAPGALVPGESYRNAVLRCLYRSDPSALAVARAVAVLGDPVVPGLVADHLGADATSVRRGLADLTAAGLLADLRFRHEEARQAVLGDVPPDDLRAMHGRAAGLLHETGAGAVRVARRLVAADDVGAPWQIEILREAAQEALALGDAAEAVGYLRHASGLCADPVLQSRITAALADAAWHLDPATASRHLPGLADAVRAGTLTGREAMIPVNHLLWRGDYPQARDLLRIVESREDDHRGLPPSLPISSDLSLTRLWLHFCFPGLAGLPDGASPDGAAVPTVWGGPTAALTFLSQMTGRDGEDGTFRATEQILRSTRADGPLALTLVALMSLIHTDQVDEAVWWADRLLAEPWIRKVPLRRALFATLRASAALRRGDAAEAAEHARAALTAISPAAWGVVIGVPLAVAVRAATDLGDAGAVGSYLNLQVPEAMFDTPFSLPYLAAFGRHQLMMGRPQAALENFRACGVMLTDWGLDATGLIDWRNDAAEALLALGRAEEARVLAEEQIALSSGVPSRPRGVALRLLAATGGLKERVTLLEEAVDALRASGDRRELGRAEADLRTARSALDEHGRARMGPLWAPELPDEPSGPDGPEAELTAAEQRVAALAADGWTNRQIAAKLYITVSTVEQHLTKIYRKLKVRGRPDLASVFTEPPPPRERVT